MGLLGMCQAALVKCFFLQGSNYSDPLFFCELRIKKIKGQSLTTATIQNIFLLWKI